jgi:primosomal protein N' (replication factor Y) (superfamily II helicase)
MYADVAVCLPLSRTFVYKVDATVEAGCRVVVPFRKREVEGFVVRRRESAPDGLQVHAVTDVIDPAPLLRPQVFELCKWISEYYVSPIGEVLKAALPPGITAKHIERGLKPSVSDPLAAFGGVSPFSRGRMNLLSPSSEGETPP